MPRSRGNRRERLVRAEPFQRAFTGHAEAHNGNVAEASDALGMSKKTLCKLKSMTVR
jgi:transcriptional regulator of acetoin/glycerol metabolism